MKKTFKKSLSLLLAVVMLVSCMVFSIPESSAASFPQVLYNGETPVIYNINSAQKGKYLVEVDVVKFSPNYMVAPAPIKSEAGDIVITYKPSNGSDAEKTLTLGSIIPENTFNYEGVGQREYYAVVDGFPTKATASLKKTNLSANDSGIYTGIKIWDCTIGTFNIIYDPLKVERSNGADTASLMFSNVEVLNQYYPYAKEGSASGGNLTLPANITSPATSNINFAVTDQWGVTMISPKIEAPSIAGLTFSQNNNYVTVKGTGDANYYSSSNNYRDVTVKATYSTANESATGLGSVSQVCRITNSTTKTYAPTYDNRTKAGLSLWFTAGSTDNPDKFNLNSSYKMTTTNYLKIRNNSTRTATIKKIETASANNSYFKFVFDENTTIAAGETRSVKIQDLQAASANYTVDADVTYTLEGLYTAASSTALATLTCGTAVPCIYNKVTAPAIYVHDEPWNQRKVMVDVEMIGNGILNQTAKSDDKEKCTWSVDYYVDRAAYSTYQSAGLGFKCTQRYNNEINFQKQGDSGTYQLGGAYDYPGSFGFLPENVCVPTDSAVQEQAKIALGKTANSPVSFTFYGTIFTGSSTSPSPATINFNELQIEASEWIANSGYFTLDLNIYALNKTALRSSVSTARSISPLSCYFSANAYSSFNKMSSSSKLKAALTQLGTDMTNQYAIYTAQQGLDTAYSNLVNSGTRGGTYCVVHQKHSGDINTPITETAVDYIVFEVGASDNLKFKSDYSTNKHSATYTASLASSGTYTHVYDYWNIDFSSLEDVMDDYIAVTDNYDFSNTTEAVGNQLTVANAVDKTTTTPLPESQNEVEVVAADLKNAMRNLEYTSFEMSVTHKMVSPTGQLITAEEVEQYTEAYDKTATYGEVLDGTADINDSTYTIKGVHYAPIPDPNFLENSSKYRSSGISSSYIVKESKNVTMTYTAKEIEDNELQKDAEDFSQNPEKWRDEFTKSSFEEFANWYVLHEDVITQSFCIYEQDAYEQILELYNAEKSKLDKLITAEQIEELENFNEEYEMFKMMPKAYCESEYLQRTYQPAYDASVALLALVEEKDAGEKAADEILEIANTFAPVTHTTGAKVLGRAPEDGIAGTYTINCGNIKCGKEISSKTLPNPVFNSAVESYYDYSNRGAALCYSEDEALSPNTQHMRFPASCVVPKDATVEDFGFVIIPTMYLNGGAEPDDNTPVNVGELQIGKPHVTQRSVYTAENPHYTLHPQADGSSVYTFNLKMNVEKAHWGMHYAVRGYVKYSYDGVSVTVYDKSYSSRSADYIAKCVMANPNELEIAKDIIGAKFGL